jgi:hypothetical protein
MRAEPHYVDLLASRAPSRERTLPIQSIDAPVFVDQPAIAPLIESVRRHGILQPLLVQDREGSYSLIAGHKRLAAAVSAGLREVPCIIHDVDDEKAEALADASNITAVQEPAASAFEPIEPPTLPAIPASMPAAAQISDSTLHAGKDLAQSLTTLAACADMLGSAASDLSRAVVANLIRAEAWRASSLLLATRTVRQELKVTKLAVPADAILDRVARGFEAERRVRHVAIEVTSDLARGTCLAADEVLLSSALGWASIATLALLDAAPGARITIAANSAADGRVAFKVAQDVALVPDTWTLRAFDPSWTERAGGVPIVVSMLALERVAAAHGGAVSAEPTARGTCITLTLPLGT